MYLEVSSHSVTFTFHSLKLFVVSKFYLRDYLSRVTHCKYNSYCIVVNQNSLPHFFIRIFFYFNESSYSIYRGDNNINFFTKFIYIYLFKSHGIKRLAFLCNKKIRYLIDFKLLNTNCNTVDWYSDLLVLGCVFLQRDIPVYFPFECIQLSL